MSDLLEGVQLSDFLLEQRIGRGGVADVYRGRHIGVGNYEVAVKVFRQGYAQKQAFREYFMAEAEKIGQFEHANILPFLEFGEGESLLYSVTPYVESGTLGDLLNRVGGKFPAMQALPIMQQLCSAVQYAHERDTIHGNFKLSNVFVGTDGRMLLADFGIVRGYDDSQQSLTRIGWGSAEYAAPEQSLGVLRRSSDIYALGALLFRILTGQPPYTGQTPVEVLLKHVRLQTPSARLVEPSISDAVDSVLQKAMQKRSDDRYATVEEFGEALRAAVMFAPVASPVARSVPATTRQLTHTQPLAAGGTSGVSTPGNTPRPGLAEQFSRSGLFEIPIQQMSPAGEPIYREDTGLSGLSGLLGGGSALEEDDAGTHLFWSVDPLEWSPIGNEQVGSVPLTATAYLQSMPAAPQAPPADLVPPATPASPAGTVEPGGPEVKKREPEVEGGKDGGGAKAVKGRGKKLLPLLVVILLLMGLLGALFSSFLFPGPSGGIHTSRPGVTATAGGATTPSASTTPKARATASPSSGPGTATAAGTAQPAPGSSPTPIPIPTNPAVPAFACASGSLALDGSASFIPAIQQLTSDYNSQCSNSVNFAYNADDSQTGLNGLMNGSVDVAYSDLPSSGRPGLVDYQAAALIFLVVVNSDTQVTNLTTAQLQGVYTGRYTNWSQVGGTNEPIVILSQPAGSTLRTIFETYVLHGTAQAVSGVSSGASIQNISGGITYIPLAEAPASGTSAQAISINGVSPTPSTVQSGAYPFWSIEHLYTNHAAHGVALSFISYCLGAVGANDYASGGAVPFANMSAAALRSHLPSPTI